MSSLFPKQTSSASDWVQAHCDGGSRGNPGPSGFGAVLVDANGRTLAELSEFLGIRTNNFAEYSGLLAVLDYALQNQIPRLKVVSDSELMVKQIQGKYKVNSPDLKPLWQEARNRIAKLDGFEISHALRHKNKEADALANQAMDRGMKRTPKDAADSPVQSLPLRAIPHPAKSAAPPDPYAANRAPATAGMLRGFTKDGVVHILGGASLPDGIFVKIIRE
ncbi:ribonuclease HI family protein [Granulicella sp. WH15]|uniref:ribonuclease HI family protein n=1 Tax=Granulicella sp. WH15 TaxID=2602070 RepID=UPI0013668B91|nr:ribonuclease HI family protein [Granulicella sp. WH15]QHN04639.1 ribonuclease HI family protein [Granulicella sp. WH15]